MPNNVVTEVESCEHIADETLDFQEKVLSCLNEISMYNSHVIKNSNNLERVLQDFRTLIHGEKV